MASESQTINMDTNSKILQKLEEILSCITRLDQAFKSTSYRLAIQYIKCQCYGHVAVNCPNPIKVTKVKKPSVINQESHLPLLLTPTVIVCSDRQPLPPLLLSPSPVRVVIDKLHVTNTEFDFEELIYQAEYSKNSKFDREFTGDNFEEFSISSPLEAIPVIVEFIDVSHKDNPTPPELTLVIMEDDVFLEDLPSTLPPMRDI